MDKAEKDFEDVKENQFKDLMSTSERAKRRKRTIEPEIREAEQELALDLEVGHDTLEDIKRDLRRMDEDKQKSLFKKREEEKKTTEKTQEIKPWPIASIRSGEKRTFKENPDLPTMSKESPDLPTQEIEKDLSLPPKIIYRESKVIQIDEETLRDNRLVSYFDDHFISDQYKILKTKILQETWENGFNTILVTSAFKGGGKSLTSANLAISLAKEVTHTVLLVDTDLRNPSLHKLFGIEPKLGLSDYLLQDVPLTDLFINPGINRLLLLPGRGNIENSSEVVGAPKMKKLVQELKTRYPERYVIFDSPSLIQGADSLILSKYVDGVILVIEAGKTQVSHVEKTLDLLKERNLIGMILNKGELPDGKKYYKYSSPHP